MELLDILVIIVVKWILHMVFIKLVELFKENKQAFINNKVLYKVILMEYILMVLFKVIIVMVFI